MGGHVPPGTARMIAEAVVPRLAPPSLRMDLNNRDIWRFWSRVAPPDARGCREWTAATQKSGYGVIMIRRVTRATHRLAYELRYGTIPPGLYVCHQCDNRRCVNPDHLFLGTPAENNADMIAKGRKVQMKGEGAGGAKLTELDVREIRAAKGAGPRALARRYGVNHTTIRAIIARRLWAHVS